MKNAIFKRKEAFAKAKATVRSMKENFSSTDQKTIGGWDAPCEPIDYKKLAESAQQQCDSLRSRLSELNHSPLERGETELSRRRTVRILTDMYYEQKSNLKLFQRRAAPQMGKSETTQRAGEAETAPPANLACFKKKTAQTSLSSPLPPAKSEAMAERLLASLTSRMPLQKSKRPDPRCLRQQDGRPERR